MIYDSFIFFNELDILEVRLHELAPVVDRFVLVESPFTFTGKSKPLYFEENKDRFKDYNIVHIVAGFPPHVGDPDPQQIWENETYQRQCLSDGPYSPNDIVLVSDVDEIPSREIIGQLTPKEPVKIRHRFSYYYFNMVQKNPPKQEFGAVASTASVLRAATPQVMRNCGYDLRMPELHGGWHLSYMGGPQAIKKKLQSFSHQEFNTPYFTDTKRIATIMKTGKDILDREFMDFQRIPLDDSFPHLVREHPEKFKKYIVK